MQFIMKFLHMNSDVITERVRPYGDYNQCVWVLAGVDIKHVEGYI